ncbi:hypothetical protein SBA5_170017 [Candidatus Sulfotelmatomonas gaucii]|uniref:Uncharacterized protein n=1 Tax=Candidatus Sulfuritelmatomonas gaucii TaxID=2043161 RepID=A0A2N9L6J8_9BACT|nr:hypothetical protein SBA5_170017 [Candidatus Sulfotelmatomonas gaucii]
MTSQFSGDASELYAETDVEDSRFSSLKNYRILGASILRIKRVVRGEVHLGSKGLRTRWSQ